VAGTEADVAEVPAGTLVSVELCLVSETQWLAALGEWLVAVPATLVAAGNCLVLEIARLVACKR
jgi:hypothetical protein